MADQPIDPRLVEQTRAHIRQLVAEIHELAGTDIPPQQFYGEFLNRAVQAVAAVGGAVWSREGQGSIRLQHHVNFEQSGLLSESTKVGGHNALLSSAFSNGAARLVPPQSGGAGEGEEEVGSNSSDWAIIMSPLQVDKQTVGVIELLMDPQRRQTALENAVRFLNELCEIAAGYLKNRQLRQMLGQQHLWTQLETFVRQIHSSLTPKEVSYIIASEGKRMVGADRVSVAIQYGRKTVVEAVSGQEVVERKSTLVQLLNRLCKTVLSSNENLFYHGDEIEGLPPAIKDALDDYLAESGSKVVAVTLLKKPSKEEGRPDKLIGTLVGELLEDATGANNLPPRMEVVAQHGSMALENALTHHRVFLLPVMSALGNATEWMRGNRLYKTLAAVGAAAVVIAAMLFIPLELRMEGKGTLVPESRRDVYAPEDAVVKEVLVDHGELVAKDQLLVEMTSMELNKEMTDLRGKLLDAMRTLDAARAAQPVNDAQAAIAAANMLNYQEQINIVQKRIDSMHVQAPIGGMISTWEPHRKLSSRPVKRGDPMLMIAQADTKDSRWLLEVRMPEHRMGHILKAQADWRAAGNNDPLPVKFIIVSHPQKQFRGHVERISTTAELDEDDKEQVTRIKIVADDVESVIPVIKPKRDNENVQEVQSIVMKFKGSDDTLTLSAEAEVRAKVECGQRPMGYVLLRELIEFVYETLIF